MSYILLICFIILTICIIVLTTYAIKYYIIFNSFISEDDDCNPFILIYDDNYNPSYVYKSNIVSIYLNDKLSADNAYYIVIDCVSNKCLVEKYENIERAQKRLDDLLFELRYE